MRIILQRPITYWGSNVPSVDEYWSHLDLTKIHCAAQLCIYCIHNTYSQYVQCTYHKNCKLAIDPHFPTTQKRSLLSQKCGLWPAFTGAAGVRRCQRKWLPQSHRCEDLRRLWALCPEVLCQAASWFKGEGLGGLELECLRFLQKIPTSSPLGKPKG